MSSSPRTMVTLASKCSASLTASCSSASGTEHVGGRVDEIASVSDRLGDALNPDGVHLVGRDEARLRRLVGLEAVVAIEREQKAERGEIGVVETRWRTGRRLRATTLRACRARTDRASARSLRQLRTGRPRARQPRLGEAAGVPLSAGSRNVRRRPRRSRRSSI